MAWAEARGITVARFPPIGRSIAVWPFSLTDGEAQPYRLWVSGHTDCREKKHG